MRVGTRIPCYVLIFWGASGPVPCARFYADCCAFTMCYASCKTALRSKHFWALLWFGCNAVAIGETSGHNALYHCFDDGFLSSRHDGLSARGAREARRVALPEEKARRLRVIGFLWVPQKGSMLRSATAKNKLQKHSDGKDLLCPRANYNYTG